MMYGIIPEIYRGISTNMKALAIAALFGLMGCQYASVPVNAAALDNDARVQAIQQTMERISWTPSERDALQKYKQSLQKTRGMYASAKDRALKRGLSLRTVADISANAPGLIGQYGETAKLRPMAWAAVVAHKSEFGAAEFAMLESWHNDAQALDRAITDMLRDPAHVDRVQTGMAILGVALKIAPLIL